MNYQLADIIAQQGSLIDAAAKTLRGGADQARDDHGRWTGGGGESSAKEVSAAKARNHSTRGYRATDEKLDAINHVLLPPHISVEPNGATGLQFQSGKRDQAGGHIAHDIHEALLKQGYQHVATSVVNKTGYGNGTVNKNFYEKALSTANADLPSGIALIHDNSTGNATTTYASGYAYNSTKHSTA